MSDEKKVTVKILKHVGAYVPGQIIEVDESFAKHLCHVNELNDGLGNITKNVRAMLIGDAEKMEAEAKNIENMTQAEAQAAGLSNVQAPPAKSEEEQAAELAKQAEAELAAEEKKEKKGKK